jgi:2-amino-4-hydroxy-6-hydroxymethyldihydropteridine diphosphokinase
MALAYIAAGSNLGDRHKHLADAEAFLRKTNGISFIRNSKIYETVPVGGPAGQGDYLNAVWEIKTELTPEGLLKELLGIEKKMGRVRKERNGPRVIDLDILFYGDEVVSAPGLTLPHPRLQDRSFVLKPLMDLCPDLKHPVFKKTIRELYRQL